MSKEKNQTPRVTALSVQAMKGRERIAMITAYDYPSAALGDRAGADILLVGDSLGQVVLGYDTTVPVTMDEMLHHTRAASRGRSRALLVGDMPFGSFQTGPEAAMANACRFLKEGMADSVKLEGGAVMAETIAFLVRRGIPVMGHVGLTPQSVHQLGGYRVQGRGEEGQRILIEDARAVQDAGAYALVVEGVPAQAAARVTEALSIPTIGIGAGAACDGQVLVFHDLLGLYDRFVPRFVKQYARLGQAAEEAIGRYVSEVKGGVFPGVEHAYE